MNATEERDNALNDLLGQDFDFQGQATATFTHGIHAFAAKFPPQLPAVFIERLTAPGDVVLDPMMGSGTTLIESAIRGRRAIGLDLDPLSIKQCKAKTTPIDDVDLLNRLSDGIVASAYDILATPELEDRLSGRFDKATKDFVDYWFAERTQRELEALLSSIKLATGTIEEGRQRQAIQEFFEIALSAIIVTKSGGVTKARDLAHGRAHIYPGKSVKDSINQFRLRGKEEYSQPVGIASNRAGRPKYKSGRRQEYARFHSRSVRGPRGYFSALCQRDRLHESAQILASLVRLVYK